MEVIKKDTTESPFTHEFYCPGCECSHGIVKGRWTFNEDYNAPTITPSILVQWTKTDPKNKLKVNDFVCHSFVTSGQIRFLNDCTHHLKGQTVPLPDLNKIDENNAS